MKNRRKLNFVMALVLVFTLVVPQGVFAFAGLSAARQRSSGPAVKYADGELIFKSKGDFREETKILTKYKLGIKRRDSRLGYILAAAPRGTDVKTLVRDLQKENSVVYAQLNYKYELFGSSEKPRNTVPNDPQYARQWAMPKINAQQGWAKARANSGITVAVLDSGVDVNHPDLKNRLVQGTNTVNPLKSSRDDDGHGTHVAGIIGATNNNGTGVTGVAGIPGIKIMPVKVFDGAGGSDVSISDGIIWAADHGARVINMSFGSYFQSDVLNDAIDYAYDKGVVLVAAAGNWASQDISYPAALAKVIAVSATDKNDSLADFSSYGPQIDVCAPGYEIYSTFWDKYKGSTYTELSGTSMASPMVAGLAALLLAKNPNLTNEEVRQIIEVSAVDLGDPGWDTKFGHGRINLDKALSMSLAPKEDSNGSISKAVELKDGVLYREKIISGSDVDWYKVTMPEQSSLQLEVQPAGKVSPGVEVYDGEGLVLAAFNTGATGQPSSREGFSLFPPVSPVGSIKVAQAVYGLVTNLDKGEYYIKIFGNHFRWSEEDYTITARFFSDHDLVRDLNEPNDTVEEAKLIEVGDKVAGAILSNSEEDWFKISLKGGTTYRIHLDVPSGLDLAAEVESETNFQEPSTEEEWRKFDDRWFWQDINNAGPSQDEDSIIVTPENGEGMYYIRLYDIGGAAVNANYGLTVQRFDLKRDQYENNNKYQAASAVKIGDEISANFHDQEDTDWYSMEVPGTGILKLTLQEPPGVVSSMELYSNPEIEPEGRNLDEFSFYPLGMNGTDLGAQTFEFKVKEGKYYLKFSNFGNISADNYTFKTQFNSFNFTDEEINDKPAQAAPISLNETKTGTLYPEGDIDIYALDIEKPQPLLVSLTPPADLDTVVVVFKEDTTGLGGKGKEKTGGSPGNSANQDGSAGETGQDGSAGETDQNGSAGETEPLLQTIAQINSGAKGQLDTGVFVVTKPGRYYILVTASADRYQGQPAPKSLGKYSLNIRPFKIEPDAWEPNGTREKARAIASGAVIHPTFMGTEDTDWFKIYAAGKGSLTVNLSVPSDIDGVMEIWDGSGKQLVKVDQSMVGEQELITLKIPKAGYYYIKTYDYLGNSSVQTYSLVARFAQT